MLSNMCELDAQVTLLSKQIKKHHNSSLTEMLMLFNLLTKGAMLMAHGAALICNKLSALFFIFFYPLYYTTYNTAHAALGYGTIVLYT